MNCPLSRGLRPSPGNDEIFPVKYWAQRCNVSWLICSRCPFDKRLEAILISVHANSSSIDLQCQPLRVNTIFWYSQTRWIEIICWLAGYSEGNWLVFFGSNKILREGKNVLGRWSPSSLSGNLILHHTPPVSIRLFYSERGSEQSVEGNWKDVRIRWESVRGQRSIQVLEKNMSGQPPFWHLHFL